MHKIFMLEVECYFMCCQQILRFKYVLEDVVLKDSSFNSSLFSVHTGGKIACSSFLSLSNFLYMPVLEI